MQNNCLFNSPIRSSGRRQCPAALLVVRRYLCLLKCEADRRERGPQGRWQLSIIASYATNRTRRPWKGRSDIDFFARPLLAHSLKIRHRGPSVACRALAVATELHKHVAAARYVCEKFAFFAPIKSCFVALVTAGWQLDRIYPFWSLGSSGFC